MTETVRFERRFQGFTAGALGGYAAGVAARGIDGPAEANLRALPPLERELSIEHDGERVELRDGETVVVEVAPAEFELDLPTPLGSEEAEAAGRDPVHDHGRHLYPDCFTCGPNRAAGDGLRLFMGFVPGREGILGTAWTPDPGLVDDAALPEELVWAALDCPTIWAAWLTDTGAVNVPEGRFTVLARQRVEALGPIRLGEPAIVSAWPISRDGRKHLSGAAIHAPDGRLLARAESLLVEVPAPSA
jgi:hypothetical protein